MNLIEKLGGYEKAKSIYKNRPQTSTHHFNGKYYENWSVGKWVRFDGDQSVDCKKPDNGSVNLGILGLMLLEHRRQHNVFEVGDWAVKTHPKNTILWPVLGVYKNGGVWLDYKGFCWKPPRVRHATDAEIEAGRRLEVNDGST